MKPNSPLQSVIQEFRNTYEATVSKGSYTTLVSEMLPRAQAEWRKRDAELHPSSFPYCPLRHAYELLIRPEDPEIEVNFGREYFLPAGHVFHAALQKWIGFSGQYIGDWKCLSCNHMHRKRALPPNGCKACGSSHLEYHELGGVWGKNIHWHTDGVFRTQKKRHWVVDFKSTSTYAIEQHRKTKTVFPYTSNRFQIESYIPLIEDSYNIEIDGWLLVYAARDNPNHMFKVEVVGGTVNDQRKDDLRMLLEQADKNFPVARSVKENPVKVFRRMEKAKLCEDRDYYDHFVHDQWDPCPLHKTCFGSKLQSKLSKAVETHG